MAETTLPQHEEGRYVERAVLGAGEQVVLSRPYDVTVRL